MQPTTYSKYDYEIVQLGDGQFCVKVSYKGHWLLATLADKLLRTHYLDLISPACFWPKGHRFFGDCIGSEDRCKRLIQHVKKLG